jgi:hypothetical protein
VVRLGEMQDSGEGIASGLTLVLIGAPSAGGKTWFSRAAIGGAVPFLSDLCRDGRHVERCDIKALPAKFAADHVYFVECSIHRFDRVMHLEQWRRLMQTVEGAERVVHVTLAVPRGILARQYMKRIFTEPKRLHPVRRVLRPSRYGSLFNYLFTRQVTRGYEQWRAFGGQMQRAAPSRVTLISVDRARGEYVVRDVTSEAAEIQP